MGRLSIEFKLITQSRYLEFADNIEALRRNAANIGKKQSTKFRIDISKHEFCGSKQAYSLDEFQIFCYSPETFVAEKIRAICQQMPSYVELVKSHARPRARDFVDIHSIAEHFGITFDDDDFHNEMRSVFDIKRVPLSLLKELNKTRDQHIDDFIAVEDTVYPDFDLKDFDFYFDYLCERVDRLEPLWRE